jgi:uncharacterized membrane protein YgaE (UPF0421/DUF939 family)
MINDLMIGCIVSGLVALVVILFVLLYQIKKYKDKQVNDYKKIVKISIQSIDIFSKESAKLRKITECLVQEMQDFKNSEAYKSYKNGK